MSNKLKVIPSTPINMTAKGTFKSFEDMTLALKNDLRKMGVSITNVKPIHHGPMAISFTLSIDAALRSKKGVRIARKNADGKIRSVNLAQNTASKYINTIHARSIEVRGRHAISQVLPLIGGAR